jgi:hypothetical protein
LSGAVDCQIAMERDAAGNIKATVETMKDGPAGAVIQSRLDHVEVGRDNDGEPITSCIIEPVKGEVMAAAKISGATKLALDLLNRAVTDSGQAGHASNHIPRGVLTVPVSLWRQYCCTGTIADSDDPDSRSKAFRRAAKRLQELGLIGIWEDLVWPAGQAGHGRT